MNCPKCNSDMWDNRTQKKNPKSPDYKCKDKVCGHAIWLTPKSKGVARPAAAANGGKWTWGSLSKTYERSLLLAEKHVSGLAKRTKLALSHDDVLAAAAMIFIAASRDGVKADAPEKAPLELPPEQLDDEEEVPF